MFLQRTCHGESISCQHGEQRSSFDRSHVYIPNPLQQENLFPSNELPPPSAGPPAAERLSMSGQPCLEAWKSRISNCHIYLQGRAAIFIAGGRVRRDKQAETQPVSAERAACHFTFLPNVFRSYLES